MDSDILSPRENHYDLEMIFLTLLKMHSQLRSSHFGTIGYPVYKCGRYSTESCNYSRTVLR